MQTVKATKALPGRLEGEIFDVDEDSARVLAERNDVEIVEVDDDGQPVVDGSFVTASRGRGTMAVTQVAAADYPESGVPSEESEDTDDVEEPEQQEGLADTSGDNDLHVPDGFTISEVDPQTGAGGSEAPVDQQVPTKNSNKADLVAYALGKVKHDDGTDLTEAELESLSKPELIARLGL